MKREGAMCMVRRVVVTGYGVVSPLGNSVSALWENIKAGKSGIQKFKGRHSAAFIRKLLGRVRISMQRSIWIKRNQ